MKLFFILLLTLSSLSGYGESIKDFPGCPENSYCDQETGLSIQEWTKALHQFNDHKINISALNKKTFPLPLWRKVNKNKNKNDIPNIPLSYWWDSQCNEHKMSDEKYLLGHAQLKEIKPLNKDSEILFPMAAWSYLGEKKIHITPTLRANIPELMRNQSFYYLEEFDGIYFGLLLNEINNTIKIVSTESIKEEEKKTSIECPTELIDEVKKQSFSPKFFVEVRCQKIFDQSKHKWLIFASGLTCY